MSINIFCSLKAEANIGSFPQGLKEGLCGVTEKIYSMQMNTSQSEDLILRLNFEGILVTISLKVILD